MSFGGKEGVPAAEAAWRELLRQAVPVALAGRSPEALTAWLAAPGRLDGVLGPLPEALRGPSALWVGRLLWDALPLPWEGFRRRPLPRPGRNDPCPCGSGLKHKRCCAGLAEGLLQVAEPLSRALWPVLLEHLDEAARAEALASPRVPAEAVAEAVRLGLEEGWGARRGAATLEGLFAARGFGDDALEAGLDLLCDLYDHLGWWRKKRDLLEQAVRQGARGLQATAHMRLATMAFDQGRPEEAWERWRAARAADPEHPALAPLELTLLVGQGREAEAAERARFWRRSLQRRGLLTPPMDQWLAGVARDPGAMRLQSYAPDDPLRRLAALAAAAGERPLPAYRVGRAGPGRAEALREQLSRMGLPLQGPLPFPEETEDPGTAGPEAPPLPEQGPDELPDWILLAPKGLEALERRWRRVFPPIKPFSVSLIPLEDDEDPWEPEIASGWLDFLDSRPEAFDSLEVLDDLATALSLHPEARGIGLPEGLQRALLERSAAILEQALSRAGEEVRLAWGWLENRPALRQLYRLGAWRAGQGDDAGARRAFQRLLDLNPEDQHGVRGWLMNDLLRQGRDQEALAFARRYPDDLLVEVAFGKALALARLGRLPQALEALQEAHRRANPHVVRMLRSRRPARPRELDRELGIPRGGPGEAWLYREDAADLWAGPPGKSLLAAFRRRR